VPLQSTQSGLLPSLETSVSSQDCVGECQSVHLCPASIDAATPSIIGPITLQDVSDNSPNQMSESLTLAELQPNADLARLQRASPDLAEIIDYLQSSKLPTDNQAIQRIIHDADNWFLNSNGVLYYIHNPRRRNVNTVRPVLQQLAVLDTLRSEVLQHFHKHLDHYWLDKCYMTIMNYFYWPGLYTAVRKHVLGCMQCSVASQRPPRPAPLQHAPLLGVMERLVIDHIQMPKAVFTITGQEVQYCLTCVHHASQWCVLIPVADMSAKTTALALQTHWIPHYGFPVSIYSDLGP